MNDKTQKIEVAQIHIALGNVLKDCVPIAKDRRNKMQGFQFRGIDDAYNALHPVMAKHQVLTAPRVLNIEREERQTKAGGILIYTMLTVEYDFISAQDGSKVTVGPIIGEAMDTGDKSCNKALSAAHKYALLQLFMIPTHTEEADDVTHEPLPKIPDEKPQAETPMAVRDQLAAISDFRAEHKTTMEENDYIDNQGERLTYKQAGQLVERIKAREEDK